MNDRILELVSQDYQSDPHPLGMTGVGGTAILIFRGVEEGETPIRLGYARPGAPPDVEREIADAARHVQALQALAEDLGVRVDTVVADLLSYDLAGEAFEKPNSHMTSHRQSEASVCQLGQLSTLGQIVPCLLKRTAEERGRAKQQSLGLYGSFSLLEQMLRRRGRS